MTVEPPDAIELLEADHRALQRLFGAFAQATSRAGRHALAEQICRELAIHLRLEGEFFDEAEAGHVHARELIGQILSMKPHDDSYDTSVTVLGECIERRFKQEREEMFPRVRESGIDLAHLAGQLRERKQELQAVPEALREDALAFVSA